jgi:hypothetical protein
MIKIVENDIFKDGQKIGWLSGNDIFNLSGTKAGYYMGNDIYDSRGVKIGYVDGNSIRMTNSSIIISVQENRARILGGTYSDVCRAAIRLIFGA